MNATRILLMLMLCLTLNAKEAPPQSPPPEANVELVNKIVPESPKYRRATDLLKLMAANIRKRYQGNQLCS